MSFESARQVEALNQSLVITSYSIHYTKLYEIDERLTGVRLAADWQAEPWRPVLHDWLLEVLEAQLQPGLRLRDLPPQRTLAELEFVITSYSIHYTKLYESWPSSSGLMGCMIIFGSESLIQK